MQSVTLWQTVIAVHSESEGRFEKLRDVSPEPKKGCSIADCKWNRKEVASFEAALPIQAGAMVRRQDP